jgi:ectoine hydroxylase-related dioxygenase (phytanoyl-CoA dioxygenase family)
MTAGSIAPLPLADRIAQDGWAVTEPCVPQLMLDRVLAEVEPLAVDGRGGVRHLFEAAPSVRALATSSCVREVAEAVLGPRCFAVRALFLDRTETARWKVVWHQELTIAVRERAFVQEFGPWSDEDGVPHVQPPVELVERMLVVRVHLDDCGPENGPVRVIPGSHRVGRLSGGAIDAYRAGAEGVDCVAERGSILAFRPLILHATSRALRPEDRRVVHFEFAADPLPPPLAWHDEVA